MAGVQESECLLEQGKNKRRKRNKRKENDSVTEQDRDFRELDSSISSNLSKREGIRARKRRKQFWGCGVFSWEGLV